MWEITATVLGAIGVLPLLFWWGLLLFGSWYQSQGGIGDDSKPWIVATAGVTAAGLATTVFAVRRWPQLRKSALLALTVPLALLSWSAESWLVRPIDAPEFPTGRWPEAIEQVDEVTITRTEGTRELQRPHETHHLLLSVSGAAEVTDACERVVDAIHEAGWDPNRWAAASGGCRRSGEAPDSGAFGVESIEDVSTLLDLATVRRFRTHERRDHHLVVMVIRGEDRL